MIELLNMKTRINLKIRTLLRIIVWFCLGLYVNASFAAEELKQLPEKSATPVPAPASTNTEKAPIKKQDLKPFTSVNLSGVGNLHITQSKQEGFTVEAPDELLPLVIVYVKDKTLYIDLKDASKHSEAKINYYLNVKNLDSITSFSSSGVYIKDVLEGDSLYLAIGNLGEARIQVKVNKLTMKIDGGGKIEAKGSAVEQQMTINGAGEINARKLFGSSANVNIIGSGEISTKVADKLAIIIAGDGVVRYCGQPQITREISPKAKVEALSAKECQ
jgi:hypothetical protein